MDLWSLDECNFQRHRSRAPLWVPLEDKDPILLMAPTRKSISLLGAVNTKDGRLLIQLEKKFKAMIFKSFLTVLLRHRRKERKIVTLLDKGKYHHAKSLRPFLKQYRNKLALKFLSAYSPEFNPIEGVWKLTRKLGTHNTYFEKLNTLIEAVSK